ncbi:unnamed protein product [Rodentolepis nana]|uniref:Transposase n=1 Tax=Rodentolepis nana TaxID=102285 RepID=A0A0R3THI5_RODNA|nr:unnamed protein product [Rodentolepis nana]
MADLELLLVQFVSRRLGHLEGAGLTWDFVRVGRWSKLHERLLNWLSVGEVFGRRDPLPRKPFRSGRRYIFDHWTEYRVHLTESHRRVNSKMK